MNVDYQDLEILKYPIGKFNKSGNITQEIIDSYIGVIAKFPDAISKEVNNLNEAQLETPYRPDGWTIRQVVHHCADSHMNAFVRFKLALTEDLPTIKPYFEDRWANLPDTLDCPVGESLLILQGLHKRWVLLLATLTSTDLEKAYIHPEHGKKMLLKDVIGSYAWHCNHHLAHITSLKKRKEWN